MVNRSKDLRRLFRESLKNHHSNVNVVDYRGGYNNPYLSSHRDMVFDKTLRIYFYEWSNVCQCPRTFYTVDAFENFLRISNITIAYYQKEILKNLGSSFVSCYKGSNELCIRGSYKGLGDALKNRLEEYGEGGKDKQVISCPKLQFEPNNRWEENEGTFFG